MKIEIHSLIYNTRLLIEQDLILALRKQDRKGQKEVYEKYAPRFFGMLRRYLKRNEDIEDVMIDGFFKIMTNIGQFSGKGSFEGWMRRIMVNEALMLLRKKNNFRMMVEISNIEISTVATIEDELAAQDILNLLEQLPTGYRTVFNLYVLEGFKHREIAEILGISINTSKSQLILAKNRMKQLIKKKQFLETG